MYCVGFLGSCEGCLGSCVEYMCRVFGVMLVVGCLKKCVVMSCRGCVCSA